VTAAFVMVLLVLVATAAALVVASRRRKSIRWLAGATVAPLVFALVLTLPNLFAPRVSSTSGAGADEIQEALDRTLCGSFFVSRFDTVEASEGVDYRCRPTILPWPEVHGTIKCVDGSWLVGGVYVSSPSSFGTCRLAATVPTAGSPTAR
jgi:hypothetical protein